VGQQHRPRPVEVRYAFDAPDQGDLDLPPDRQSEIESTVRYLGVEVDDALEIAEKIDV
jgi:hypothetical protein